MCKSLHQVFSSFRSLHFVFCVVLLCIFVLKLVQPRTQGLSPTHGATAKTLVQAGYVTPQNLGCIELPPQQRGVIVKVENCYTNCNR